MSKSNFFVGIVLLIIIGSAVYFFMSRKTNAPISTTDVIYKNIEFGFSFNLPDSWKGYTIVSNTWSGDSINISGQLKTNTVRGPLISIRHPAWTMKNPRQDIPIMIFTIQEWKDMQADKFHIGAAPINPSELGRNSKYVFAIPARYNFSYLTGFEEVDLIIKGDNFHVF